MTDAERRAPDDEKQLLALATAEEAGTLPKKDRRHEPKEDVGDIPLTESFTAETPDGDLITFVAEEEPAPVVPSGMPVVQHTVPPTIPNDQISAVLDRGDGVKVTAGGHIITPT